MQNMTRHWKHLSKRALLMAGLVAAVATNASANVILARLSRDADKNTDNLARSQDRTIQSLTLAERKFVGFTLSLQSMSRALANPNANKADYGDVIREADGISDNLRRLGVNTKDLEKLIDGANDIQRILGNIEQIQGRNNNSRTTAFSIGPIKGAALEGIYSLTPDGSGQAVQTYAMIRLVETSGIGNKSFAELNAEDIAYMAKNSTINFKDFHSSIADEAESLNSLTLEKPSIFSPARTPNSYDVLDEILFNKPYAYDNNLMSIINKRRSDNLPAPTTYPIQPAGQTLKAVAATATP
jgi:hypothetical protein